jgi:hypothetical protein
MAPRDTVKVGGVQRMSSGEGFYPTTPPPGDEDNFFSRFKAAFTPAMQAHQLGIAGGGGSLPISPNTLGAGPEIIQRTIPAAPRPTPSYGAGEGFYPTTPPAPSPMSFEDYLAAMGMGGGGGGAARPDFSAYRAALTEQAGGLNAQIQAMYNALAGEAGANVGRIQDIYGSAGEGIGNVYDSATGNVADAYSSAQQQAADQMARLGIEAAAPAVIDPMALSQAQAVSGLEQGRASGQSAAERYGASAAGFGSQMAQTAQQQGTEMNAAILASLQNRLADSLAAEQTGGGGGGGGMSVRDQLALQDAYRRDVLGEMPLDERRFAFEQAQAAADPVNRFLADSQKRIIESLFPSRGGKAVASPEDLIQSEAATYQQLRQALGLG